MCGITGLVSLSDSSAVVLQELAIKMVATLIHRGPDNTGVWSEGSVAMAHRRLAILDLSSAGHQPMTSACGRFVIVFNGEIYNHLDLRQQLGSGFTWRGHSDTETLLAAISHWGLAAALSKSVGMFAFALWDRQEQTLTLVRDRLGEKPLYYGRIGQEGTGDFVFASELKALRAHPRFDNSVCRDALVEFLRLSYIPAPLSIHRHIYKLEPGCLIVISRDGEVNEHRRWWSLQDVALKARSDLIHDETQAIDELERCLIESTTAQSLADVPLGAFLSGGVDSSTVVALMQRQASRPVKTFTIGFDEAGFDEAPYAKAVARHLGTDHHEMRVDSAMARAVIPSLPLMYDEPFADSSQIPTHLVCQAARQQVTVALSGDGGDELFGGYNRYFWGPKIWDKVSGVPFPLRRGLGRAIQTIPISKWDKASGMVGVSRLGDKAHKLAARMKSVRDQDDLYRSLITEWPDPVSIVKGSSADREFSLPRPPAGLDAVERMMFWDSLTYLPDDILCKVDRAAMAVSLETRVPFLDHRVVELAWRLPLGLKIRGGVGKWVLRQVLYKHVPKELIERPKAGFAIPIGQWLRGPLKDWAQALLEPSRIEREGYLHSAPIHQAWVEHQSGSRDHTARLWTVLMFQSWLEQTA